MLQVAVFLGLAFSVVIAIFAVQNTTLVPVAFLWLRSEATAVSVLVLISAALGAAVMLMLGLARELRMQWRNRALHRQLRTAEARIRELEAAALPAAPAQTSQALPASAERSAGATPNEQVSNPTQTV